MRVCFPDRCGPGQLLHTVPIAASCAAHPAALPWNVIVRIRREAEVTAVDLLVFGPWLIFGAGLAVIGYLLLRRRGKARHRRRHSR